MSVDHEDTLPPPRGATIRRNTARVIPIRRGDHRCLLLHGWDPDHPEQPFWFTYDELAATGATFPEVLEAIALAAAAVARP